MKKLALLLLIAFSLPVHAMDQCGDPNQGYMIEIDSIKKFVNGGLIMNYLIFEDGELRGQNRAPIMESKFVRSSSGPSKKSISTIVFSGEKPLDASVVVYGDGRNVVILDGQELNCVEYADSKSRINVGSGQSTN